MRKVKSWELLTSILVILLFTLPTVLPLLHKGYFLSDDGEWMVVRLTAFFEAIRHGQFPTRFLLRLNNEFGYPLSNFAYPGFLYLGSIIHLFKFGYIETIKIIIFLSLFLSSVFSYLFLRKKFDNISSLVGSFVYLYTPYHLFDLYRRGSIGEILSIAVIPFLFWQVEKGNKYLISLGVFSLILSHNIIAFISLPFIFLYSILQSKKDMNKKIVNLIWPYVIGVALSSFFFIPAVYDLRHIVFTGLKIADWRLYFADVRVLGLSTIFIVGIILIIFMKKVKNYELLFFLLVVGISSFMAVSISTPIWNIIPSSFILFPFRFLSVLPIGLAFLSAIALYKLQVNYRYLLGAFIVLVSIYSTSFFLTPTKYLDTDDNSYLNNFATTTAGDEYMPKWVKVKPLDIPQNRAEVVSGSATISSSDFNSKNISITQKGNTESIIRVNAIYFPGWQAYLDGMPQSLSYQNPHGVMDIRVPRGEHSLRLAYNEVGIHLLSDLISLLALASLALIFLKEKINVSKSK